MKKKYNCPKTKNIVLEGNVVMATSFYATSFYVGDDINEGETVYGQ